MNTRFLRPVIMALVLACSCVSARGAYHTFAIVEVFSSVDGSVQFVRMHEQFGFDGQNLFVEVGCTLTCSNGSTTHTYNFSSDPPSNTANKDILFGTANLSTLIGVTPNFIIPANFLFLTGATVSFNPFVSSVSYGALPTDGLNSLFFPGRAWGGTCRRNFGGMMGTLNVPPGRCCVGSSCSATVQGNCSGAWTSGGTCNPNPCGGAPSGSCCVGTSCTLVVQASCSGGTWTQAGVCNPNPCIPPGACCAGATCRVSAMADCSGVNLSFVGGACNAAGNFTTPCCKPDFNHVNGRGVQDLFDYLGAWFAGNPLADFNGNGAGTPSLQSLFNYLGAWFAGGC